MQPRNLQPRVSFGLGDSRRRLRWRSFVAFFNQLSGINAILYFAPRIFEMTGLEQQAALLQSIGIGVTNLIFTFLGLWLIDRLGRRTLLLIGSLGYIASLGLCSWAFSTENFQYRASLHLRIHCSSCGRTGGSDLGADLRNFPQPSTSRRSVARVFHPLDFCGIAHDVFSIDGVSIRTGPCIPLLLHHDGAAIDLGDLLCAGNQRCAAGRHSKET